MSKDQSGFGEMTKWLVLGVAGFAAFVLYQQKKAEGIIDDIIPPIVIPDPGGLLEPIIRPFIPDPPPYTLDAHGCRSDIQRWCPTDNACRDKAIQCSPVVDTSCPDGRSWNGYFCEYNLPVIPPVDPNPPVIRVGDMCYKNGYPLNVPLGTSCEDALAVMCQRFGPGSKWC